MRKGEGSGPEESLKEKPQVLDEKVEKTVEDEEGDVKIFIWELERKMMALETDELKEYDRLLAEGQAGFDFLDAHPEVKELSELRALLSRQLEILKREPYNPKLIMLGDELKWGSKGKFLDEEERKQEYERKNDLYKGLTLTERKRFVELESKGTLRDFILLRRELDRKWYIKEREAKNANKEFDSEALEAQQAAEIRKFEDEHPELEGLWTEKDRLEEKQLKYNSDNYGKEE